MTTCNGYPLVRASIHEPLYGVWIADVVVDAPEALTGTITLDIEGVQFLGAVWNNRSAIESGKWEARIAGGQAAMGTYVPAKNYLGVNARAVLNDLATATSESIDSIASDGAVLATSLSKWHRMAGTAGNALSTLLDELGSTYRMQRTGLLKIGAEDFVELDSGDDPFTIVDYSPQHGHRVYAPTSPIAIPGVSIDGVHVEYVWTEVAGGQMRQTVWFADA